MANDRPGEPLFEPVPVPKRNFEVIVESIRRQIYAGNLKPGQKLPNEMELARQFNVGRSAVREALKVLELSGLLTVRRGYNGGTFVTPPDFEDASAVATLTLHLGHTTVNQLIEARDVIEVRAAELAAERATDPEIATLEATIQRMERNENVPARYIAADLDFHIAIAEIARNNIFSFTLGAIRNLLAQDLNRLIRDRESRQVFIIHHRDIAKAIADHDATRAGQAMRYHLQHIADRLLPEIDTGNV